jgi:hypothetical protein
MRMRAPLSLFSCVVAASCGDYVRYDGSAAPPVQRGDLDEETRRILENADHFEHALLEGVLASYVLRSADGSDVYVDYATFRDRPQSLLHLDRYLAEIAVVRPDNLASFEERLAYWINGYNASVIRSVLDGYREGFSVSADDFVFFSTPIHELGGEVYTLDQIEHGIIRGDETHEAFLGSDAARQDRMRALHAALWGGASLDARIHVALNCAARSCPNLPSSTPFVYRPGSLETQLDAAARAFADNDRKGAGPDGISRLFDWFAGDWENDFGSPSSFIESHREGGLNGVDVGRFLEYDWTLNEPL